ncbi:MAG: efflux RND transporter periplasmic adaptor subunit [Prevotellaceae bacterium]|nr:efflux RND transporter periplasmic adaptor subunit [Prevotellaceae bacterium]
MKTLATTGLAGVLSVLTLASCHKKPEYTYSTAKAEKTNIVTSVTATGTIEPVTSVEVGTQVSGIISNIYVDYNSIVKAGEVIAELDRTNLISELNSSQASLKSAESDLNYQETNYKRYKNLYDKGLISADDYDQAYLNYVKAKETLVQQQENVKKAETNLGYATITSPIDGVILSKEVEEGQTVASSYSTPTLFTIAQDLTDMRVIADVDEADIGEVKEGQRVSFTVDAFPDDTFEGFVTQVRQEATTESNVVTYEVVISAPNDDLKLKPGLTANVTIFTLEQENVLAVPTKAIRFTPVAATLNSGETITDVKADHKVWVKEGPEIKAIAVEIGTSTSTLTQITKGISEGTVVLTDVQSGEPEEEEEETADNPFMPHPKNNNNKSNSKSSSK